jgi:hypothetical protein
LGNAKSDRTVEIPVRLTDGRWAPAFDLPWPRLCNGAVGTLVVPASAIDDSRWRAQLLSETQVELLPAGTTLVAGLNPSSGAGVHPELKQPAELRHSQWSGFGRIELREPLRLLLRAFSAPRLLDAKCWLPHLEVQAGSVNEAYSRLSRHYETHRRSSTGNVFAIVHGPVVRDDGRVTYLPLDVLRADAYASHEKAMVAHLAAPISGGRAGEAG